MSGKDQSNKRWTSNKLLHNIVYQTYINECLRNNPFYRSLIKIDDKKKEWYSLGFYQFILIWIYICSISFLESCLCCRKYTYSHKFGIAFQLFESACLRCKNALGIRAFRPSFCRKCKVHTLYSVWNYQNRVTLLV